jgi:type II secretory pathway pseudopilin PulG
MPAFKDRRRAQSGTTLVELLVSLVIIGLALVLVVGTLSTGLLDAVLVKRNTAAEAVSQYEMDRISASTYNGSAEAYSDCFATDNPTSPAAAAAWRAPCPTADYSLRADVSWVALPGHSGVQVWTITVTTWPSGGQIGNPVSVYKVVYR